MTDPSPTAARAPPPLGLDVLFAEALRAVHAHWPVVLGLWAAEGAWTLVPRLLRQAASDGSPRHFIESPAYLAQVAASAVVAALLTALTLRLFLTPGPRWWRPDRGFWVCAGLLVLASLGSSALSLTFFGDASRHDPGGRLLRSGFIWAAQIAQAWIYVRLMLWPIGALMGQPAMTPARSWAVMRGQVASFVIAVIVLSAPLILLTTGYTLIRLATLRLYPHPDPAGQFTWLWAATAILGPAAQILQHAMAAAIWRSRGALNPGLSGDPGPP